MTDPTTPEPAGEQAPLPPDATTLTPEEWDAVRRLRGERAAETAPSPVQPAAVEPAVAEPAVAEPAVAEPAVAEPAAGSRAEADAGGDVASRTAITAVGLLLVLAMAAAALMTIVAVHLSDKHASSGNSADAIATATGGVATVLSYNYRSLDADFAKAEALLTPSFRKSYITTTAKAVQPLAAKYKAVSTAQVTAAGVVASGSGHIQVLVFVDQQVTNTQLAKPRLDRSRINVDLVHHGDRWLINKLTPV